MEEKTLYSGSMNPPDGGMTESRSNNTVKPMAAGVPKNAKLPDLPNPPKTEMPVFAESEATIANMPAKPGIPQSGGQSYKKGELPHYAPLAAGYVPYQQMNPPKYSNADALTHGTLFPGLDLPFMNIASKNNPYAGTPLGELMALDFAVHELTLYLDTHENDSEAFEMLKSLIKLAGEGKRKYEQRFGPVDVRDLERAKHYSWLNDPWPWEYAERTGGR